MCSNKTAQKTHPVTDPVRQKNKQAKHHKKKIRTVSFFYRCWLHLQLSSSSKTSPSFSLKKKKFRSIDFKNCPSFQISWTWSDVFRINKISSSNCLTCLLAGMAKPRKCSIEVLHGSHACCLAGTMKISFCTRKNIFSHNRKNILFLPCNMAAVQNFYSPPGAVNIIQCNYQTWI